MALVWIIRHRPGESSSVPLNGFQRTNWKATSSPASIEIVMKVSAAM